MKNKILYIIPSAEIGGTENMVIALTSNIKLFNFEPVVLTLQHRGPFHEILDKYLIKNYYLNLKKNPLYGVIKCVFIFFREKPCLVQSFLFAGNIFARILRIFFPVPLICSQRSTDDWRKKIHWMVERYTSFLCCLIVSNSNAGKRVLMEKAGINCNKIVVIPNGIDIEKIKQYKTKIGSFLHRGIVVGSIGNLRKAKGYDVLVEAASIVCKKRKDIKFIILGKGPLEHYLKKKIKQLHIDDSVEFYGFVDNVYNYILHFDIVIIPSLWEGFPVVALESMACGKPIVATTAGDMPEIIQDGINGLIVEPGNAKAMADALIKLVDNPNLMKKMGERSEGLVEKFSLNNMVREYVSVYENILQKMQPKFKKKHLNKV